MEHTAFVDPATGRPQLRYVWRLQHPLPEGLLRELTFGVPTRRKHPAGAAPAQAHFRAPGSFDELRKAYSYVLGTAERTVVPEHQNYQVRLSQFLKERNIMVEMEKNFVDVSFAVEAEDFIGEIKVTRNLTIPQAFRAALGQLLEYGYLQFPTPPHMIIFLDQRLDDQRLRLASTLGIAVVFFDGDNFILLNPDQAYPSLAKVFQVDKPFQKAESA